MKSSIYPEQWKIDGKIVWNKNGIDYVDRMSFSRYQFSKYWNVLENYDNPAIVVHRNIIDHMPKKRVKFLDRDTKERTSDI
jgi:hypothetical protein